MNHVSQKGETPDRATGRGFCINVTESYRSDECYPYPYPPATSFKARDGNSIGMARLALCRIAQRSTRGIRPNEGAHSIPLTSGHQAHGDRARTEAVNAATLIGRLEGARQTAPDRWIARCPAHADRAPSLSIRELSDGRTLLHCHAGCGAAEVLGAVGLTLADLFPERLPEHSYRRSHATIPAGDLLMILDHEITVAALILSDLVQHRKLSEHQVQRLTQCAARVGNARSMANPAKVDRHAA